MDFSDWIAILTLLGGSGIIATSVTLLYNYWQNKIQRAIEEKREASHRDFEARKEAKDYYKRIYGYIAILDQLVIGYFRSLETGKAEVFTFKDCVYRELPSEMILEEFEAAYESFLHYYVAKKCEGFEIFLSLELKALLIDFWSKVQAFKEDKNKMTNQRNVDATHLSAEKTTEYMEKLFGLKQ